VNLPQSDKVIFIKGSILDEKTLEQAFSYNIDVVFHLAAHFANQNSVDHPQEDLLINGLGTLKILEFAQKLNVKKFIYTSSSCVYGNRQGTMNENDSEYQLDTPYAITKLLGERYATFFHEHYGLNTVVLRYFNSYGPGEFPGKYRNVIPNFLWLALNGEPLPITGTGEETRDFNYVGNVIGRTLLAGKEDKAVGEIINIGSGREVRIIDLANAINNLTKNKAGTEFIKKRNWDTVAKRKASTKKAEAILGPESPVNLETGLTKTFDWLKGNLEQIKDKTIDS
jgi:nucleoside-diphosphate-sugar epimerase